MHCEWTEFWEMWELSKQWGRVRKSWGAEQKPYLLPFYLNRLPISAFLHCGAYASPNYLPTPLLNLSVSLLGTYVLSSHSQTFPYQHHSELHGDTALAPSKGSHWGFSAELDPGQKTLGGGGEGDSQKIGHGGGGGERGFFSRFALDPHVCL